jgi:ribosome-associated heat shock protein Hsp15
MMENTMRIDKWLWCVRFFKTRSQATEACRNGKIHANNNIAKASQQIKIDDIICIRKGSLKIEVRVLSLLKGRLAAKLVGDYYEDLTAPEEYEKYMLIQKTNFENRGKGLGRPSKKERREMEKFKKNP